MIGTILSIIFAAIALVFNHSSVTLPAAVHSSYILVPVAILVLFFLLNVFALTPLQKSEQNLAPGIFELMRKDHHLGFNRLGIFVVVLAMAVFALAGIPDGEIYILPFWLIALGITLDLMTHYLKRISLYLSPAQAMKMFTAFAKHSVQNDKGVELCDSMDALAEMAQRALDKSSFSLCNQAVTELQIITRLFLESSKSIGHSAQDEEAKSLGIKDRVSFTLFYLFQRLELIYRKAEEKKLEPACAHLITMLGKVAVDSAKLDLTLPGYAINYIGQFACEGEEHQLADLGLKGTCTLLEVAKAIIKEVDIQYGDLKDVFFSIIQNIDDIQKDTFTRDKTINIKLLIQPFLDLQDLFKDERAINHQDTKVILQDIERVLAEYAALEMVMKTLPPIPSVDIAEPASPLTQPPSMTEEQP